MKNLIHTFLLLLLFTSPISAQYTFRIMSYNVENLFDTLDNPEKEDDEFLPSGNRYWTQGRYYHKLRQIAKAITAAGEWSTPALIGLCEVENDSVLHDLTHRTPLRAQAYRYIITKGPDPRGINVALLYQRDQFKYLQHESIPILFTRKKHKMTRDILHVWGKIITGDTIDVFICHFPSRYGGEKESEQDRYDAAQTLRISCDSICKTRATPLILIMGDFNDTPQDKSILEIFKAYPYNPASLNPESRPNLFYDLFFSSKNNQSSHKYQGEWRQLDHIIVNQNLIKPNSPMRLMPNSARIFSPPFLLIKDKTWRGFRPFRTYYGFKYEGGFSDHLPLIADFYIHLPTQTH